MTDSNAVVLLNSYMKDYYEELLKNRAIIAIEDGLKPIQRKLLYSFFDKGHTSNKNFSKSATSVGEVLRFSPHGDASAYDAAINMSCFMNNVPLLELHGGNKTIYGSPAAAPRYTELRTSKFSDFVLLDKVDKKYNAVNYIPNYDESLMEPEYLPAKFPVFLLNGSLGIAGGFMGSILPHSINTIADKTIQVLDNPNIDLNTLIDGFLPSFSTGGIVINKSTVTKSYTIPASIENKTNGTLITRAKIRYNEKGNYIQIYEVPYYITVDKIIDSIKSCIKEKSIDEINGVKNLSAGGKVDIRLSLKRGSDENAVIGKLYKLTCCQNSVPIVNILTHNGNFKIYNNVKEMLIDWIDFRISTLKRIHNELIKSLNYDLHIKEGLLIICENPKNIDKLIEIVRNKKLSKEEIFNKVQKTFDLSNKQTEYILATKIINLSNVSINDLKVDIEKLKNDIDYEIDYMSNEKNIKKTIKEEILEVKKKFGNQKYNGNDFTTEYIDMDLSNDKAIIEERIPDENFILMLTKKGFLKKIKIDDNIKSQKRRGVGTSLGKFKQEDSPLCNITANSKDNILLFTENGYCFRYKCYELPNTESLNTIGKTILGFTKNQKIIGLISLSDEEFNDDNLALITLTKFGKLKATWMNEFISKFNNLLAVSLAKNDSLKFVTTCNMLDTTNKEILICSKNGFILKNDINEIKMAKRNTMGNDSFLKEENNTKEVLSCEIINSNQDIIFIYSNGLAKRCKSSEFPKHKFRTKGVKTGIKKDAELVACLSYENENDVISIISNKKSINVRIKDLPFVKRVAFGSVVKKLDDGEKIIDATLLDGDNIKKKEAPNGLKEFRKKKVK